MNWKGFLLSLAVSAAGAAVHAIGTAVGAKVPLASTVIASIEQAIDAELAKVSE